MSNNQQKFSLENSRLMPAPGTSPTSVASSMPSSLENGSPLDTGRRFSFTQKLLGTSKDLISSFYSFGDKDASGNMMTAEQSDDFANQLLLMKERRRTNSVSSDVSTDEQPHHMERKNSIPERLLTMQQSKKKPGDKFAAYRSAITSYID